MAGAALEDVQVIRESSWIISQGSLDSCITVVFLDPASGEPAVPSSPHGGNVVLVPPPERIPCEVTIKFQGRLCDVQSFYILSTARTCELYSQSEPMQDPEYICTVRGWTPERVDESFLEMDPASYLAKPVCEDHGNEAIVDGAIKCAPAKFDSEPNPFDNIKEGIQTVDSLRKNDPAMIENDDLERSVYSSGEDSWVEVRLNGSLSCECSFERPTVSPSVCGQLDEKQQGAHALESKNNSRTILVASSLLHDAGMNCDNLHSREPGVSTSPAKILPMPTVEQGVAQQNMYEAELELVDHRPWASLKIRLLSLQDRSRVIIDNMVLLVVLGPPVPVSRSSNQSGSGGSSALLAMLMPSMLQMVRGVPNQRLQDTSLRSVLNGNTSSNNVENMSGGSHDFESTSIIEDGTFVRKDAKQNMLMSCIQSGDNAMEVVVEEGKQGMVAPLNIMKKEINIKTDVSSRTESALNSVEFNAKCLPSTIPLAGETQMLNSEKSVEPPLQAVPEIQLAHDAGPLSSHLCEHANGSNYEHKNWSKSGGSTLEAFTQRFDRLEALCMRMEAYLISTVERLDQRLTLLETEHSKVSVHTPFEPKHYMIPPSGSPYIADSPKSPELGCLGGKEMDSTISAACDSETQGIDVKKVVLGSHDINTSSTGFLGGGYEVTKSSDFEAPSSEIEDPPSDFEDSPSNRALGSRASTMAAVLVCPERRPRVSLDDAWASALLAFSSSSTSTETSMPLPFVALDSAHKILELKECSLSSDPSSDVSASTLHVDLDCTVTKATQDLSWEIPTYLFSGVENSANTSPLIICGETDLESHYRGDIIYKENHLESLYCDDYGKANQRRIYEKTSLFNEANAEKSCIIIDTQGHNASQNGTATQSTDKDANSFGFLGQKSEKKPNPCSTFDLLSCSEPSEHIEQNITVSVVENLILFHNELLVDVSDPEPLAGYSSSQSAVTGVKYAEINAQSCEAEVGNLLGEDSANDQDDTACSENSVCSAQVFDCEWTSSQYLLFRKGPEMSFSDPEPLDGYSSFQSAVNDMKFAEMNAQAGLGNLLGEDIANDQDDARCSESIACNAQEFDCEWTSAQNLFLRKGPETMVTELRTHEAAEEICNSELPCIHSKKCSPEDWFFDFSSSDICSLHVNHGQQQKLRCNTVFPGFEDFS